MSRLYYTQLEKLSIELEKLLDEVNEWDDDKTITADEFSKYILMVYNRVNKILNN